MKTTLHFPPGVYEELLSHLLPPPPRVEEAVFVFVLTKHLPGETRFEFLEAEKLSAKDFEVQHEIYLELTDEARQRLIKRAHDLKASVIEMHSHTGNWPAEFSSSDRSGLKETVPHMWWRLPKRPYGAIVVADGTFDALVWVSNPDTPETLDALVAGNRVLRPTNNSIEAWR